MSDDKNLDKTNVVDGDTLKLRLDDVKGAPPAFVLLMGPTGIMGKQWPLTQDTVIIGRDISCDIHISEKSLSKKHAKVELNGDEVSITDLQSTNGTEVQGTRLEADKSTVLKDNDQVKLGNVIVKFLSQGNIEAFTAAVSFDRGTIDQLTQIHNKASTMSQLEESFKRATLTETNLSLIVFDLDHFKSVNDTHGHQAGDYVLREVAAVVKNQLIRSGDVFGRYGGEEFVVILYGSPLQRAFEIAERIRSTIEKHDFNYGGKKLPITVSLGVAALDSSVASADKLFEKSDEALYNSKSAGRNRVSIL